MAAGQLPVHGGVLAVPARHDGPRGRADGEQDQAGRVLHGVLQQPAVAAAHRRAHVVVRPCLSTLYYAQTWSPLGAARSYGSVLFIQMLVHPTSLNESSLCKGMASWSGSGMSRRCTTRTSSLRPAPAPCWPLASASPRCGAPSAAAGRFLSSNARTGLAGLLALCGPAVAQIAHVFLRLLLQRSTQNAVATLRRAQGPRLHASGSTDLTRAVAGSCLLRRRHHTRWWAA